MPVIFHFNSRHGWGWGWGVPWMSCEVHKSDIGRFAECNLWSLGRIVDPCGFQADHPTIRGEDLWSFKTSREKWLIQIYHKQKGLLPLKSPIH